MNTIELFFLIWAIAATITAFHFWRKFNQERNHYRAFVRGVNDAENYIFSSGSGYKIPFAVVCAAFLLLSFKYLKLRDGEDGGESE